MNEWVLDCLSDVCFSCFSCFSFGLSWFIIWLLVIGRRFLEEL